MSGQQLHPLSNAEPSSGSLKPDSAGSPKTSLHNIASVGESASGAPRMASVDLRSSPRTIAPSDHKRSTLKQSLHPQRGARPTSEILKPGNYANPESKEPS
jgi:hypothetical protein